MNRFEEIEEVIQKVNQSPYGLALGLFSENLREINYVGDNAGVGMVWVNHYNDVPAYLPFGGRRMSGEFHVLEKI